MLPLLLQSAIPPLKDWGRPEALGGRTLEGDVRISGTTLLGSGRGPISAGWFAATRGRYRLIYPFHEHATLVEGELALTCERSGETVVYGPGDSWVIGKGDSIIWDVRSPRAVKHYLVALHDLAAAP